MDVSRQQPSVSAAEAETRLRYVQDVRSRTRHAVVVPVLVVGMLGVLIVVKGLLMRYWPHVAGLSAAWFLGVTTIGLVAARRLEDRQRLRSGVLLTRGGPVTIALVIAAMLIAHVIGANVIIAVVAAALSLAAWRTGMRMIAVEIVVIGAISEALVLQGARQWAALVIFGTGLVVVEVVRRCSRGTTHEPPDHAA